MYDCWFVSLLPLSTILQGFKNPTKTDCRFFRSRLRELIQQGIIERVLVPHIKSKDRTIKCIRLVEPNSQLPEGSIIVGAQDVDDDEKDAVFGTPGTAYTLPCDVINPGNQIVILTSNLT